MFILKLSILSNFNMFVIIFMGGERTFEGGGKFLQQVFFQNIPSFNSLKSARAKHGWTGLLFEKTQVSVVDGLISR